MLCSSLSDSEKDQLDLERVVSASLEILELDIKVRWFARCLFCSRISIVLFTLRFVNISANTFMSLTLRAVILCIFIAIS